LLPVAWHVLREKRLPPVAALRGARVPIAIASDCNPGSAPGESLQLAMAMAARDFGLQPAELLAAVTGNAARALGMQAVRGQIVAGQRADFAVWDISSRDEFGYWLGHNPCVGTVRDGSADARLVAALANKRAT
jgi:imidazolonepropionase